MDSVLLSPASQGRSDWRLILEKSYLLPAHNIVRIQVKRLLEDQGATYSASLELDGTSLLLCSSDSTDKFKKAKQWGVPCLATRLEHK